MKHRFKICFTFCFVICVSAQTTNDLPHQNESPPQHLVLPDCSTGNKFAIYVVAVKEKVLSQDASVSVVARLGTDEHSDLVNQARLSQVKSWFTSFKIPSAKITYRAGERVNGKGQVNIYVGTEYFIQGLAAHNALLCIGNCSSSCTKPIRLKRMVSHPTPVEPERADGFRGWRSWNLARPVNRMLDGRHVATDEVSAQRYRFSA